MQKEPFGSPPESVLRALREWRVSERKVDPKYSDATANPPSSPLAQHSAGKRVSEDKAAAPKPAIGHTKKIGPVQGEQRAGPSAESD